MRPAAHARREPALAGLAFAVAIALFAAAACSDAEEAPAAEEPDAAPVETEEPGEPVEPGEPPEETPSDASAADAEACTDKVVINELMPYGKSFNDEFIELYNPNGCVVPLDGFRITYQSAAGVPANGAPLHAFAAGTSSPAKGFFVVGTQTFAGMKDATFNGGSVTENGGMSNEGQIALLDGGGQKMDSVGYGGVTGDYVEKSPAPKAPATGSIARKKDGVDTDDNSADFDWVTKPTPGAAN